ncbi:7658_t:CDS:2 [Dentiscutata heterogama]|uniref:7658_t:CDS:1 n=1 Tax=Dentiscutata heterogama TaxID=1316150 RepID=A0ACA9LK45_9GLOM|nr:7658_t:CDS:2 [Dentiscutata heterogama]
MLYNKFGTKNNKNNKIFSLRQRFSYNISKPLTQDSTMQLDYSFIYSSDEPMKYYEESNEHSFEKDNISYHDKSAIYSSEELDEDINSFENEFFEDIADKALDLNKLSQNISEFSLYFENTTTALMFS